MKVVVTFELLELDLPAQTLYPTANTISLFAHVFQFSFSYFKLHPLKLLSGAKSLPTSILLCDQEEQGRTAASAAFSLTLAGRQDSSPWGLSPLPHIHMGTVFPMVAAGQRGSSTCAIDVVLCKSTGEFRPVSINLLS